MKIALAQINPIVGDFDYNIKKILLLFNPIATAERIKSCCFNFKISARVNRAKSIQLIKPMAKSIPVVDLLNISPMILRTKRSGRE